MLLGEEKELQRDKGPSLPTQYSRPPAAETVGSVNSRLGIKRAFPVAPTVLCFNFLHGGEMPKKLLKVFNVYFSVVKFWLSSHIWLFRLVSSQLISQLIDASCRQHASAAAASLVQPRHVILSVRVA
ncbi:hypothetical protein EYF80_014986 [Liparis tanakae]|uniref:Uncharacterized protein n=1 Tax=Liparis tanakae TaxID=230148 RepID=A0A4Z2IA26_9TELE|nr:hypothetical protein EYF80_014986 [Liparis tanakae]